MEAKSRNKTGKLFLRNGQPNPSFVIQLALAHAPVEIRRSFQSAFATFAQVLLRQRQLTNTRFSCSELGASVSECEDLVDAVCEALKIDRQQVDPDRVVWLEAKTLARYLIRPGQWINVCQFREQRISRQKIDCSEDPYFTCQILPKCSIEEGKLLLNSVTEYNLRRTLNVMPFAPLPDLQIKPLMTEPVIKTDNKSLPFSPMQAKSIKLAKLRSCAEIEQTDCDILLRDKFLLNHKYVCVGDVISCELSKNMVPFELVVVEANDKGQEDNCKEIFKVSSEFTKLVVQSLELSNQFHVKASSAQVEKLLAPCVRQQFIKLEERIMHSLHFNCSRELWPSFLLYGPIGSGKTVVSQSIAAKFGLNFHWMNGVNLIGDTSAYAEGKLRAVQDQVKNSLCPSLLYIKNIHLVGKDKDGNEDKRVVLAFKEFLDDLVLLSTTQDHTTSMASRAVFVVATTNFVELLVPSVAQIFLCKFEFPPVVSSIVDLEETLRWFLRKGNAVLEDGLELGNWIKENCVGMKKSYGDLKALVAEACRMAFINHTEQEHTHSSTNKLCIKKTDLDHAVKIIDSILKKAASTVEVPKVSWEDIGGLEEVKKELINSVRLPLEYPQLFAAGIRRSGILLYGPPGTGKTLIAKAVATEFKLSFLSVKGPELLNMYVGQSEQNVRNVFEKARNAAPCIIFFDELDALAPNRGRAGDSGGVMDRVVSQILAELDGTHSTPGVFVIGATNRPDLIDPALLRPGRFDKLLYVGINQDVESKTSVLKALTRKFNFSEDVDLSQIASMLPNGMSGADLYSVCSDTYMTAVERYISNPPEEATSENFKVVVCFRDFEITISRASTSLSEEEQAKYEALKTMTR